jgi:hypothetical protein
MPPLSPEGLKLKRTLIVALFCLASPAAFGASAGGPSALALAAAVGDRDPELNATQRLALAELFAGQIHFEFPSGQKIIVKADKIVCRVSNVAIADRSCELSFGPHVISLAGRVANELYDVIAVAGVAPDGAAGSIFEALHGLECAVEPGLIRQKSGAGADCAFTAGP